MNNFNEAEKSALRSMRFKECLQKLLTITVKMTDLERAERIALEHRMRIEQDLNEHRMRIDQDLNENFPNRRAALIHEFVSTNRDIIRLRAEAKEARTIFFDNTL